MKKKFFQITKKSFEDEGVSTYKDLWEKVKGKGYTAFQATFVTKMEKAEDSENTFHAVLSDSLEDRHGDIVKQKWDLKNFKRNPVLLDSHDYWSIEKIIGQWKTIKVEDDKLQGDIEFALFSPLGKLAHDLAKEGFLRALSAGFIPLEFGDKGEIKKSELLEGSMVSVPANPRTLLEKSEKKKNKKKEKTEPENEPEPAQEPEVDPEPAQAPQTKSVIIALKDRLDRQDSIIRSVAQELSGINGTNVEARKRKLWKSLRGAL